MRSKEDISEELKPHWVKQNGYHLEKIISSIDDTMNPFVSTIEKEHLFNIANEKAALGAMVILLTKVWAIGFSACDCFIKHCNDDPDAYQNTIKRQKIKTFASEAGSYKVSTKNKSLVSVSKTRDLFGSILFIPCEQILTWSKYFHTRWHRCHCQWATWMGQCRKHQSRGWKKSCIKSIYKRLRDHNWWYVLFGPVVPTSTFASPSLQTRKDINLLSFWQSFLVLYKGCWMKQENKPARHAWADYPTWTSNQTSIKLTSSDQRRSIQGSSCYILVDYLQKKMTARILGSKKLIVSNGDACYSFIPQADRMVKSEEIAYCVKYEDADTT